MKQDITLNLDTKGLEVGTKFAIFESVTKLSEDSNANQSETTTEKISIESNNNTEVADKSNENEENIEITFKNKGATIPEYKLERIFDKFYRADESRQTNNGGAGLGLAITKEIIELHNGKICAKSNDEFIEFQIELKK